MPLGRRGGYREITGEGDRGQKQGPEGKNMSLGEVPGGEKGNKTWTREALKKTWRGGRGLSTGSSYEAAVT